MSLNWEGNRAEGRGIEFKLVPGTRFVLNEDGRKVNARMEGPAKVGDEEDCVHLFRRYQYTRGGWSRWGKVGSFEDEAAAKKRAEEV